MLRTGLPQAGLLRSLLRTLAPRHRCLAIFSNVAGRVTKPRPDADNLTLALALALALTLTLTLALTLTSHLSP